MLHASSAELLRAAGQLLRTRDFLLLHLLMEPAAIHDRFATELHRFAAARVAPSDVDDLLQDVFERVVRASGHVRDEDSVRPWLYRIVRNAIADRARRRTPAPLEVEPVVAPSGESDEAVAARCLVPLLEELPDPARAAIESIELGGASVKAAADAAHVSEAAMKSRVLRARAELRDALVKCCRVELDRRGGVASMSPVCSSNCGCRDGG